MSMNDVPKRLQTEQVRGENGETLPPLSPASGGLRQMFDLLFLSTYHGPNPSSRYIEIHLQHGSPLPRGPAPGRGPNTPTTIRPPGASNGAPTPTTNVHYGRTITGPDG
jgi:hypothetical protein